MIDVAHDRDNRRSWQGVFDGADLNRIEHHALFKRDEIGFSVEFFGDFLRHFFVERLVDRGEHTAVHQFFDHVLCSDVQLFGEIFNRQTFR